MSLREFLQTFLFWHQGPFPSFMTAQLPETRWTASLAGIRAEWKCRNPCVRITKNVDAASTALNQARSPSECRSPRHCVGCVFMQTGPDKGFCSHRANLCNSMLNWFRTPNICINDMFSIENWDIFHWRVIVLWCCVSSRGTAKGSSHINIYTYVYIYI